MTAPVVTLTPAWLKTPALQRVFAALGAPAVDVRAVGGSVRDAILARDHAATEIDLGTPELPDRVMQRLEDAHIKVVPTGLDHGTVTAIVDGRGFEITTLRRDTACDGRHAAVEFTIDWHEDARRRDFTMNAMSLGPDGVLHDDYGGVEDARAGRVRFVGDPSDRIQEDYLRILRLFRFAALYGRTPIDAVTLDACARHKDGMTRLSTERVHDEMAKLLAAPDPVAAARQMLACGVLSVIVPEHRGLATLTRLIDVERLAGITDHPWIRRLAALVTPASAGRVAVRLKLSNDERARLEKIAAEPALTPAGSDTDLRRALFYDEVTLVTDRLLLAWAAQASADTPYTASAWRALVAAARAWIPHPLPVSGSDVLALDIAPGPEVGRILAAMTEWWIAAAFKPARADALMELRRIAKR